LAIDFLLSGEIIPLGRQLLELTLEPGINGFLCAAFAMRRANTVLVSLGHRRSPKSLPQKNGEGQFGFHVPSASRVSPAQAGRAGRARRIAVGALW
jgi:hypothetical protein